eukprot:CAMPEP_0182442340 /NCGR_PEP_ID=MMETSP1172-20130603/1256_1 /TAXON_ID=708627 /ORGANISM="Timspurckia oligopyrenoides, Strain CCMP3278" /LENGTH=468 /DNA_ID=CAMNT_0024637127 /DNA_START=41 /DNA_END=1447 /DNA_ORIENTATION=-
MSEYDLTGVIAKYLDRHLVFPLLEFVEMHPNMEGIYDLHQIGLARLELISNTNMIDSAMEMHEQIYQTPPPDSLQKKRDEVILVLQTLQMECSNLLNVLADTEVIEELRDSKSFNATTLITRFGLEPESIESLYEYAKFQFDCGNYPDAGVYLDFYRQLSNGANPEREFFALWGKFASDILNQSWDAAMEDVLALKDTIDAQGPRSNQGVPLNPLQQLQQRTWLIHWSLYVFFNHPNGRTGMIDLFLSEMYLNTIQTNCPHILRYLTAAIIANRGRRGTLKDLIRVIKEESNNYNDPITQFVECLYVSFDFEGAQDTLKKCEDALKQDFFLVGLVDEFVENARLTIFETYCRIHQVIDIGMLADKLNMDRDSAERWIVNLVRNARLDAKIDSEANQVLMGVNTPSVYEEIMDSTKALLIRTHALASGYGGEGRSGQSQSSRGRSNWRGGNSRRRTAGDIHSTALQFST